MEGYNQIKQYEEQAIYTMSRGELLIKLFDEALKNMRCASAFMKNSDEENTEKCLNKARDIFSYLSSILDNKYEISYNLHQLYYFINQEIIRSGIKRDPQIIDNVIPLVEDMRETWVEAEKLVHMQK
ncbi:MAG: flagellar export chaperone FliS [Clostridiales bacterium]|nr:flagellar export chaperone FliS [Clostridiales bacterium]